MADDVVSVELTAKTDGLNAGLEAGLEKINSTLDAIRESLHHVDEKAEETEGILKKMLSMESFEFIKERATEAFEVIEKGFDATIGKAEEFSLSNAKFAAMMGTSETEAAGLSAALRGVGSSAEDFEGMALRLEMRLKTTEPAMQALGLKTRDANGELLGGKALMDNAIAAMQEYKAGTDQNSFALEVFGRRAADVYDLMRVSNEDVQKQVDIYREFGVELEGTGGQAQEFESSMNDLHTMFDALTIKIGQELMPAAQAALRWMGTDGKDFLVKLSEKIEELVGTFVKLAGALVHVVGWFEKAYEWGEKLDKLTGGGIGDYDEKVEHAAGSVDGLSSAWDRLAASIEGAMAPAEKAFRMFDENGVPNSLQRPAENPYIKEGGSRKFVAPGKGGADKGEADEIKAAERLSLAKLAIEESTNQHELAMGQETTNAFVAQQRALEDEKYTVQRLALQREYELQGQSAVGQQKALEGLELLATEHAGKLAKIDDDADNRKRASAQKALTEAQKADDEELASGKADLDAMVEAGSLSAVEKTQLEINLTNTIRGQQLARLDAEILTLKQGTDAYTEAIQKRDQLEKKFVADRKQEHAELVKDNRALATEGVAPFASAFKTAISDMTSGTKSFQQTMDDVAKSIENGFISMCENIAEKWLVTQITNALIGTTTQKATAIAEVGSLAAVGAAGAASSQAAIPIIGPALATAAGAEMAAYILGFESLASAAGGMTLDKDQLVYAHAQEMILPAHLSQGLQSMINGGHSGGGGTVNLHYAPTINGSQNIDLARALREQPGAMMSFLAQQQRNGAFR